MQRQLLAGRTASTASVSRSAWIPAGRYGGWLRTPTRWTNQARLLQYFEDLTDNEKRPPMVQ